MMWKVLARGIRKYVMWNMKALSLTVHKLWPRLKFLKSRSNLKVKVTRSKIMVWCERSCHKECTCEIWKSYLFLYARLQTGRIMVCWCPSVRVSVRPSVRHSFPHFSPTCFEILSWNFVHHFILMHVRSSSSTINFRQFLLELCPFWTSHSY